MARAKRRLPALTDRLSLGLGLEVSPVCLGMVSRPEVVLAAFDAGINFFFVSADMHWPLYEHLREGLRRLFRRRGVRDEVVVCATAYVTQPEFCEAPFEEVVDAIKGLGRLDVLTAGGAYASDLSTRLTVYRRHRASRFCGARAIAASFHDRAAVPMAVEHDLLDLAFVRFNPVHPGARHDLFPLLSARRSCRLFNFKSMDGWRSSEELDALGLDPTSWRPHPTDFYRYALSQPQLDGALIALSEPSEVRQLSDALAQGPLDAASQDYLEAITAPVGA